MRADLLTGWRHLFSAVLALSTDGGPVDRRLQEAYRGSLQKISPDPHLPQHLQADFETLMDELRGFFGSRGPDDMKRAASLARKVVVLYDRVTKEL